MVGKSEGQIAADVIPTMPMRATLITLLAGLLSLCSACAGTPDTTGPGEESHFGKVMIQLVDFRAGVQLALANETTLDRVDYYSAQRSTAGLKVASDEIINALVEELERLGFWDAVRTSTMPSAAGASEAGQPLLGALSLETDARHGWITFRKGLSEDDLELFNACSRAFAAIYNSTAGYQRVSNPKGEALFRKQP